MVDTIERYRTEVDHICRASLATAERHYTAETPWCNTIYWLGIPATVLSAIAGAAAFSKITNSELLAGSISILVAILSSLMTFLDPTRKATNHLTAAKSYETLYREAGYFKRIELQEKDADLEKSAETLKSLARRLNDLNMASPRIPGRIYRVADRKLAAGRGEVVRDPAEIDTRIPERMQNS